MTIEDIFSETVNRDLEYHVFLTPVCQEAVLLFVTAKEATGFSVRGVGLDGQPSGCGFDYRITAKRLGVESIRLENVSSDHRVEAKLTERGSLPAEDMHGRGSTP